MGSSKKHKEKDREREHKRKRHRRSRSRSRSRERKSRRQHSPENADRFASRDGRDSYGYREGRDRERERYGGEYNDEHSFPPAPQEPAYKEENDNVDLGKEQLSLSIEETNKLRAKLGLKPLEVGGQGESKSKENQDVHVPAINLSEKLNTEKLREKMLMMKEKRKVKEKLKTVKGLGESDSEEDDVFSWVKKNRKVTKEREMADKRAKMLEEMDAEFGVGSLVEQEFDAGKKKNYSSHDLSGLRVEHNMEKFKEGSNVVLTLKDKGVLDEEDDDVLINVNIIDDEKAEKNVENKKKKPDYKPYDEAEVDEYGMFKVKDVLDKYDEEIHGEKRESFVLGSGGSYDAEHERNMDEIRKQLRKQGQSLKGPAPKIASEYMTREEVEVKAKFKKVKKKVRKIRKKEVLKADDLLPLPDQVAEPSDYGSRQRGRGFNTRRVKEDEEEGGEPMESLEGAVPPPAPPLPQSGSAVEDQAAFYTGILPIKQEPADFKPPLPPPGLLPPLPPPPPVNDEDVLGPDEDLTGVAVEEETVRQELQSVLNKTRRLQQRRDRKLGVHKVMESIVKKEEDMDVADHPIAAATGARPSRGLSASTGGKNSNIILNSTSEFCRSLGEIPTYGLSGNREEEREEIMDLELELMEQRKQEQEMEEQASGWAEVDIDTNPVNILGEEKSVLEEEPIVTDSIGSALKLAMKKGYLDGEGKQKASAAPKHSSLQAQNYSIEDKRYDDLDEKYRKRDRYGGGMITDFKDKEGYKPEIRLEYVDETGRTLNPKEAFRQLSHRFHGKGSGKKKTEKRQKKVEEEQLMKQMSSTDTPLNTLSMLQDKQRSEKSPYVVLSGNKTFSSASQTLSKPH
ncbi:U4/U6.U5 tri-snRNP-associated protein 1-like [Babylonia areolata]|uniref:U4/U6.U5 tri-snRNP-associated protein 1-like n=1 Tax=Babylonia areolata TaxID=304850 RepID=UPI003FD6BCE1